MFRVKKDEEGHMNLKEIIVVHVNRDSDKESVRTDCAASDMDVILLLRSVGTFLGFTVASSYIKGAYI